jgi:hypothetical protein
VHVLLCDSTMVLDQLYGGPSLGELSGGNWMILWEPVVAIAPGTSGSGTALWHPPTWKLLCLYLFRGLTNGLTAGGVKIVTWLILPVVICLSQRLSHACLSISNLYCETANGSLNQS